MENPQSLGRNHHHHVPSAAEAFLDVAYLAKNRRPHDGRCGGGQTALLHARCYPGLLGAVVVHTPQIVRDLANPLCGNTYCVKQISTMYVVLNAPLQVLARNRLDRCVVADWLRILVS